MDKKERLTEKLNELCVSSAADVSVLWREIGADSDKFAFEPEKIMVSASMIKVPIMLAALNEVKEGRLRLEQQIAVPESEILDDSEVFDLGPRDATLRELITWMITESDNTATNVLIELLGMDAVNRRCVDMGASSTSLNRKMLDLAAVKEGRNNFTSARDMFLFYSKLEENMILTRLLCETALGILKKQRHKSRMLRYIWEDVAVAHKTGGLDHLTHDAGIFYTCGKRYFLGVFLQNCESIDGDPGLIGRISRLVFDYYLEGQI